MIRNTYTYREHRITPCRFTHNPPQARWVLLSPGTWPETPDVDRPHFPTIREARDYVDLKLWCFTGK